MKAKAILAISLCLAFGIPFSVSAESLMLSQTQINLSVGQSATVTVSPPSGQVANIFSNTNTNIAAAILTNNTLSLLGLSQGSSQLRICTGQNVCADLWITVGGGGNNSGTISFSNSNLSLSAGQTSSVNIYGYNNYWTNSGQYYISSNSNSSVASASVSGSVLNVNALAQGSTTITVCMLSSGSCGSVYVSVSGGSNNGNLWLSSDNVSLNSGQTTTLTIYTSGGYYGTSFYVSSNSNSGTVSASVSGNSLALNALSNGSSTVTVCGYSYSGCDSVYVTVSGSSNPGSVWVSPSSINLNVGQTSGVSIYSDTGSNSGYYVSSNSNTNAVTSTISGNNLNLTGNNNGYATVLVCAYSSNYACASVYVTVNGSTWNQISFLSQSLPQPTINQYYSAQLSVSGGSWPYYFSLISGSLPNGLTLSSSGLISGTPTTSGYYNFQVRASDSQNRTGSQNLSVTVGNIWGGQTYKNGTLISENGTIYIVYKNLKSGFANMWSFSGLGYKAENILNTGFTNLANSGYVINTMQIAHPWGSWIKSGSTVYFVHQDGLIPIPSFDVFLNNGGEDRLVVPANSYDFSNKPVLGLMTSNDWRLR